MHHKDSCVLTSRIFAPNNIPNSCFSVGLKHGIFNPSRRWTAGWRTAESRTRLCAATNGLMRMEKRLPRARMKRRRGRLSFPGTESIRGVTFAISLSLGRKLLARVKQKSQVEIAHGQAVVGSASHHMLTSLRIMFPIL